jgi:hypothetical protein
VLIETPQNRNVQSNKSLKPVNLPNQQAKTVTTQPIKRVISRIPTTPVANETSDSSSLNVNTSAPNQQNQNSNITKTTEKSQNQPQQQTPTKQNSSIFLSHPATEPLRNEERVRVVKQKSAPRSEAPKILGKRKDPPVKATVIPEVIVRIDDFDVPSDASGRSYAITPMGAANKPKSNYVEFSGLGKVPLSLLSAFDSFEVNTNGYSYQRVHSQSK